MRRAYSRIIESIINTSSFVRSSMIYKKERESEFLFLRGDIQFSDGTELYFREFVRIRREFPPDRYSYAYHYQDADKHLIFRYDNAPHYPNLENAPHHKHIGSEKVVSTSISDMEEVIKEIEIIISKKNR